MSRTATLVGVVLALAAGCTAKSGSANGGGASGRGGASAGGRIDGALALAFVDSQLAFGPRVPNTPGHQRAGDWLAAQLGARADTVIVQAWRHTTRGGTTLALRNFFARFRPDQADRVLFVAHWDTRPHADRDADPANQRLPVPGANDGASGVAVLLAMADALKHRPPGLGVDLLLVDGEDWGTDFSDSTETLLGSWHFAATKPVGYAPLFAVVFDMVGDRDLQLYYEGNSHAFAPEVVQRVWRTAESLSYGGVFIAGVRHTLTDDHIPLQRVGIHAIDVIDFDYPYWHTVADTRDKVSAESLEIVGNVGLALVR
jgi:Zn-dependent M28 family amino/carboxypeptidase